MSALDITQRNGEFFVTSETVAAGAGVQHASVLRVIDDNMDDFESFGMVGFQIRARSAGQHGGGDRRVALLNEQQSTLLMTYQRNTEQVRAFKKALVKAFYEMARQVQAPKEVSRRDLAQMVLAAEDEADRQRERAEVAEQFKSAIERNEGLSPRAFHKHYFPDVTEREFFDLLYKRRLLIDQRRKGTQRDDGTFRNGSQHGHPGFAGKAYFYVDSGVNQKTGYRFEQTLVRPGQPEVALVNHLAKLGLTPQTSKELAHV